MARGRLLDVPWHEPRSAQTRAALRVHLQPEFRGAARLSRPHAPGIAADGGGGGNCRAFRRRAHFGLRPGPGPEWPRRAALLDHAPIMLEGRFGKDRVCGSRGRFLAGPGGVLWGWRCKGAIRWPSSYPATVTSNNNPALR